jgi:hypothetical protein
MPPTAARAATHKEQIDPYCGGLQSRLVAKRGNPNMVKGGPSINPSGISKKRALGSDGVTSFAGYVSEIGEGSSKLTGRQKWITYANAFSHPAVAIALLIRSALLAGTKWSLEPNPAGGADADRGAEIVEQGLLSARLPKPWSAVVRKAGMHWFNGFSMHAAALGRRADGAVVFTDIAHRPQHTIDKWFRADPQSPWESVEQRTDEGKTYPIDLDQCLYLVHDVVGDAPTGTGVLRFVVERLRRIEKYEGLEGSELFSSMGGTPIYRAPLEELGNAAPSGSSAEEVATYKSTRTEAIRSVVQNRIKTPERQMYLGLDSKTYEGSDPNTISTVKKWDIEIVKGELQGLPEIRKVISDLHLDVARILGVEFAFVGGGDTAGTYGMHESKVELFTSTMQTTLTDIATAADRQLVRRLIAANGLDPDTAAPRLVPSRVRPRDVLRTAQALGAIQLAQLPPNHPAKIALFGDLELPWVDEEEGDIMAPRRPAPVDEQVDDVNPDDKEQV